jgi:hypothetical protein
MKYLNKYNKFPINEGKFEDDSRDELLPNLIDNIQDFIDDGYNIFFSSLKGDIRANIYLDGGDVKEFNPTFKAGNKIKSKFKIIIQPGSSNQHIDNEEFAKIVYEMTTIIKRIADLGWDFDNFSVETPKGSNKEKTNFRFTYITYTFTKPDVRTEDEPPSIDEIKKRFEHFGLNVEDILYDGNICHVGAESYAYDGEIPEDIEDKLDRMIQELGFDYYEHETSGGNTWLSVKFWIDPVEGEE